MNKTSFVCLSFCLSFHIGMAKQDRELGVQMDGRKADRQTGRQADRQTGRQADRQTGRQADRQTGRQADRQTDKQTNYI
jgi:hypothetical protein